MAKIKKEVEVEYDADDAEAEDTLQGEDLDVFDEDDAEDKPTDISFPETFSLNISYRSLLYALTVLSAFSTVAVVSVAIMTMKRMARMERRLDDLSFELDSNSKLDDLWHKQPHVCENCKNQNKSPVDDWLSMLQQHAEKLDDVQNQNIPKRGEPIDIGSVSVNELYKVKRGLDGKIIDIRKQGSYVR